MTPIHSSPSAVTRTLDAQATAVVQVIDASFSYTASTAGADDVLRHVNFAVDSGSICALLGENGAGKSTLARLCAGVLAPRSGSVLVDGKELAAMSPVDRIRRVRVSFQYPEHELFRRTLALELEWEAGRLGADPVDVKGRATAMLERCGFPATLESHPYDLDPWARKLFVSIAALAVPGRLVILDEPTIRLAQLTKRRLAEVLLSYVREGGAILAVTHDYEFCLSACDTVALMAGGCIERQGPVGEVLLARERQRASNIFAFSSYYLRAAVEERTRRPR